MNSRLSSQLLPAPDRHVDIGRIECDEITPPLGLLRRDQGRAAAAKGIEDDAARFRAILDRIHYHGAGFDRRMSRELFHPAGAEGVDPGIDPGIGPIPPMLAQFDIVDVRCLAFLPQYDQLVRGPVERAHAAIGLGPADDVLQFVEDRCSGVEEQVETAPVHAGIDQRAVGHDRMDAGQDFAQERAELGVRHFARGHGEFAMLDPTKAADMVGDGHVGRYCQDVQ